MPGSQVSRLACGLSRKVEALAASWIGMEETSCYAQLQSLKHQK